MYAWLFFSVFFLSMTSIYLYVWWVRRRAKQLCADMPGWPEMPIIGNMHQLYGDSVLLFRRLLEMSERSDQTNRMFRIWVAHKLCLVISKPEDAKAITNAFIEKPYYYRFGREWLGDGLVTAPDYIWKRNIKKLAGSFTGTIVDGFQDVFKAQAVKLVEKLKKEAGKGPFDAMDKYLAYTTLETICQSALGMEDISQKVVTSEYYNSFNKALELIVNRGLNIVLHPEFVYRLTPAYYEFKNHVKVLHNVSNTVIKNRRLEREEMKKNGTMDYDDSSLTNKRRFKAFLDLLLEFSESDPTLTDDQIRAEVDTVIVGGQETTASTLCFSMLMLGCHVDVQNKLMAEFKDIFGDSNRPAEREDLVKMKYCEAVIYETLRLFPPIPVVLRYSDKELKLAEYTIPDKTTCAINAWGAGRSWRNWGPDAQTFRPERWLEESQAHPAAFLPFSFGRRSCIGKKYALNLLKTILCQCVRELVIQSNAQNLEFKLDLVLRPISGNLMSVQLR